MAEAGSALGHWLQAEIDRRGLNQMKAAAAAGIGVGTISDIIRRGHVPKLDTLFRLADRFDTPRERLLRLAAGLPPLSERLVEEEDNLYLLGELLSEFRRVPDDWKPVAVEQVALLARLARRPPARFIGEDDDDEDPGEAGFGRR
jgi:transcriptional regulator with XRE-family HTH domain